MRTPPDLHPDDLATRENLRDILIETRRNYGMTLVDLSHLMGMAGGAWHVEHRLVWRTSTVQRWAHALRLRLLLWPECLPPDDVSVMRPADPVAAMRFDRWALIAALVDARRWVGMTQRRVGEGLGIGENGVAAIEHERDVLLVNAQRYCRALGSVLMVELEEVTP